VLLETLAKAWPLGLLALLSTLEFAAPLRMSTEGRGLRWPTNLTLASLNGLLIMLPAIAPVALAVACADRGWGLLHHASVSLPLAVAIAVIALDLLTYLQHRLAHANAMLWRIHRVHHADVDLDATTGFRFHPLEALMSNLTLIVGIVVLGLPPLGVGVYLALSAANTIFTHANIRLPSAIESGARWLLVTPALHALHHSAMATDSDRNFATVFSVWDRLGSTYSAEPHGHGGDVRTGLAEFREPRYMTLPWTLALPFCASPPVHVRLANEGGAPASLPTITK
jgi:sterol desaturase/sphingolipid hydroxylase (fatty acid hydroxylase superfamily)